MRSRVGRLGLTGLLALSACRGAGSQSSADDESSQSEASEGDWSGEESSTSGESGFDPLVCESWEPPVLSPPDAMPPEAACEAADPNCPQFTAVTSAAHILHTQYFAVTGAREECIFDLLSGEAIFPHADCEPQWFTGGASVGDIDNDGWPDLYVTRLGASARLYRNRGDGRFDEESEARGLGECSFANGSVFGDIDNDGDQDLLVTVTGAEAHLLYINDGNGNFTESAAEWGFDLVGGGLHGGESVTLGDYDLDGWLDVHVNGWIEPHNYPDFEAAGPHGSRLLHNTGQGRFEDVTESAGTSLLGVNERGIYGFSSAFVDLDNDRWPELAIAADFRSSRLYWNQGDGSFVDGTDTAAVNREGNAMGSTFGDFDGDGRLDWFVSAIAERNEDCDMPPEMCPWKGSGNRLYHNEGDQTFLQAQNFAQVVDAGWAWGAAFQDFDNDGDQDLVAVNGWPGRDLNGGFKHQVFPARLWRNDGNGVFDDVAAQLGANDSGQGRSVLPFDYDLDGDLDLFITNHAQTPTLLRNDGGNDLAWIDLELTGTTSNRDARGAVVELQAVAGGAVQRRQLGAHSHFLGEPWLVQHFGLGAADLTSVHEIRVTWPASQSIQIFNDVPARQRFEVVEAP